MKVHRNEVVFAVDVDGTLVSLKKYSAYDKNVLAVHNPYVNEDRYLRVHKSHVQIVKEMLGRGRLVLVWSASGFGWAEATVKALGLNHKNLVVMTKPIGHMDDLDCTHWMGNRLFIKDEELENG